MHLFFPSLDIFSCDEHYTLSVSDQTDVLTAIIREELSTQHLAPVFSTEESEFDVVRALLNNFALVKIVSQTIVDTASTRKLIARDTLFQPLNHSHFFTHLRSVISQELDSKR